MDGYVEIRLVAMVIVALWLRFICIYLGEDILCFDWCVCILLLAHCVALELKEAMI